ncbi:MAG: Rpn family recombination-promoting nuclease/putative transposase [Treponema sp.]|nr:Rpn family recombination-promoting nuclease/putative transposase [Treponema sp.]
MKKNKSRKNSASEEKRILEKKWKRATLSNNFIFYKVMRAHPDACRRLIEMLLGVKIKRMKMSQEETIAIDPDAKSIRLDVFVKGTGKMYDVEMQMANTHELAERSRYYQGVMDVDTLKPKQKYKDLPDSHVIFICLEDIFKNGLPVNTFENICIEDGKTKLRDRAWKHFFFAPLCATMIDDEEVKAFFEFLISNQASSGYTDELKAYVADAKRSAENKMQFMTWERQRAYDYDDGKEAGIAIGAQQKAIEDAKKFLADGKYTAEEISGLLGIPVEAFAEPDSAPAPAQP